MWKFIRVLLVAMVLGSSAFAVESYNYARPASSSAQVESRAIPGPVSVSMTGGNVFQSGQIITVTYMRPSDIPTSATRVTFVMGNTAFNNRDVYLGKFLLEDTNVSLSAGSFSLPVTDQLVDFIESFFPGGMGKYVLQVRYEGGTSAAPTFITMGEVGPLTIQKVPVVITPTVTLTNDFPIIQTPLFVGQVGKFSVQYHFNSAERPNVLPVWDMMNNQVVSQGFYSIDPTSDGFIVTVTNSFSQPGTYNGHIMLSATWGGSIVDLRVSVVALPVITKLTLTNGIPTTDKMPPGTLEYGRIPGVTVNIAFDSSHSIPKPPKNATRSEKAKYALTVKAIQLLEKAGVAPVPVVP